MTDESYRRCLPPGVGDLLRDARLRRGWSLRQAANYIGVSPGHLCNLEHGRRAPRVWLVERLVHQLRLSSAEAGALLAHAAPDGEWS